MKKSDQVLRLYRKSRRKTLKTYWWRYKSEGPKNFGDEITSLLVYKLYGITCEWTPPNQCDFAAVGSIIEILQRSSESNDINLWGSGFIQDGEINSHNNLHFSAVRGKKSAIRVADKNIALGDPGLLMPYIFHPKSIKKYRLGIIPHYVDKDSSYIQQVSQRKDVKVIDVFDSVESVVRDIQSCELVISSSLHGLIMSDAYGIPNYWMPFSDLLTGGDYKFSDYYSVFDRTPQPIQKESLPTLNIDDLIHRYIPLHGLNDVQEKLFSAFPFK